MPRARSLVIAGDGELNVQRDPQRPSGRLLRQAEMDASYVDLADPRHLEFDYLRWARLILRAFAARHVLHVGGGACALARALLAEDRSSRHEVFEIDARAVSIAREHLGLRRQPGLRVRVGDGRDALTGRAAGSADAIVVDAFVGARVPRHLVTAEALWNCARVAPLTVVNVVDTAGWRATRAPSPPDSATPMCMSVRSPPARDAEATSCSSARRSHHAGPGSRAPPRATARRRACSLPRILPARPPGTTLCAARADRGS